MRDRKVPVRHDFCLLLESNGNNSNYSGSGRAIVVGFREEQLWLFVSSGGTFDDTGDLAPQLPLILSQE